MTFLNMSRAKSFTKKITEVDFGEVKVLVSAYGFMETSQSSGGYFGFINPTLGHYLNVAPNGDWQITRKSGYSTIHVAGGDTLEELEAYLKKQGRGVRYR